jgi:ribosomal-protein-alanine N-acetyltransferase
MAFPASAAHAYYRDVGLPAIVRGDEWHWTLRMNEVRRQSSGQSLYIDMRP